MIVHHVELGRLGTGLTGGESCLLELVRAFAARGLGNVVVTTDHARREYERLGLGPGPRLHYRTVPAERSERRLGALGSYLVRTRRARRLAAALRPGPDDLLICNSELLPNGPAFRRLADRAPGARRLYWLRSLAPDWARGYEGQFADGGGAPRRWPSAAFVHFKLAQARYLAGIPAGSPVLVQNEWFRDRLAARRPDLRVVRIERYPGRPALSFDPAAAPKRVDLAWMGRFHPQKGLLDLVDVLRRVRAARLDATLLVLGDGPRRVRERFLAACRAAGVADAVTLAGHVRGEARWRRLAGARVFLLTSRYEGAPNVALEAMACGLPVVRYALPVFARGEPGVLEAPPFDTAALARAVLGLLRDEDARRGLAHAARRHADAHRWPDVADQILRVAAGPGAGRPHAAPRSHA